MSNTQLQHVKRAWAAYWLLFAAVLLLVVADLHGFAKLAVVAWLLSKLWLSLQVARSASHTGGSPLVWGLGVLLLGPLGALLLPWFQVSKLRANAGYGSEPAN